MDRQGLKAQTDRQEMAVAAEAVKDHLQDYHPMDRPDSPEAEDRQEEEAVAAEAEPPATLLLIMMVVMQEMSHGASTSRIAQLSSLSMVIVNITVCGGTA